jgi:hypothetical protein
MTRFTSILSALALVPTTLALAAPALASTLEDVDANQGRIVDPSERIDLNCDGVVNHVDLRIVRQVTTIHSAPGFAPHQAVRDNLGASIANMGRRKFPYHADLNGDCSVGVADLLDDPSTQSALGEAQTQNLLEVLGATWGTYGESDLDLNCDGKVGMGDWWLVNQVVNAENSPHYDPLEAADQAAGSRVGDANYHPAADLDGDCVIGVTDLMAIGSEAAAPL